LWDSLEVIERQLLLAGVENVPKVLDPHGLYRHPALPEPEETPAATTTERGVAGGGGDLQLGFKIGKKRLFSG
jgi:hypothetical protein